MDAVQQRLVRSGDKLIQLFDPPFDKGALQPGCIKGYVPGITRMAVNTPRCHLGCPGDSVQGRGDRAGTLESHQPGLPCHDG
jgi:hypothetical protein